MIIAAVLLTAMGIMVIYSSSQTLAVQQVLYASIGLALYFIVSRIDFRSFKPLLRIFYILTLILLSLVLLLDIETRGSVRWIPLGIINFQPSEFAKITLILYLAHFWTKNLPTWSNISKSVLLFLPIAGLIFRQPDLGTTLTVAFIWAVMLLGSNVSIKKLLILVLMVFVVLPGLWLTLQDYQKTRILTYMSPGSDPLGAGYNVIQSVIAVGSGQAWGRGLGRGTQSRLQFLPEYRTDFIFASIAEEFGSAGSLIVLFLYSTFFYLWFRSHVFGRDRFAELVILGVSGMVFFQMSVNIGMNIGLLPVTGITLPFISYGGSSLITMFMALGLVVSVEKFAPKKFDSLDL